MYKTPHGNCICLLYQKGGWFGHINTVNLRRARLVAYWDGGAEIARPDKTTQDQTARLNNGGHEQSIP